MDLIDRQVAVDAIQQHREDVLGGYEYDEGVAFVYAAAHNHIIDVIKHLPSTQQEIIHCRECIHWKHSDVRKNYCEVFDWMNTAEDFCSFAERKDTE